jgi:hypothetical protein
MHLRVVSARTPPDFEADTVGLSLTSAPFRPGELPVLWWAQLGGTERELVVRGASQEQVPATLWLRTAVESARVVADLVAVTGNAAETVTVALDSVADERHRASDGDSIPGALDRYADLLVRGDRGDDVGAEVVLRLSEEMAGAWRRAAIASRMSIPAWISARLADAPDRCVGWEIAAARSSRTLAEWAYASALSAMTSSSA